METLKGNHIFLRALEPADLDFLYTVENDENLWNVSNTTSPFSRHILQDYLNNSHRDIYEVKQLRLVICKSENASPLGFIDLYDFEPKHRRVGVGIVIYSDDEKRKGYALEALKLVCRFAFKHIAVHQIYAGITENNQASIKLFEKAGFERSGTKKEWIYADGKYLSEYFYQLMASTK